ncbi:GNAT family N-acetyltransferase [Verrucomicrobiaceae bacterium 227]
MAVERYSFRPICWDGDSSDLPFLCELYASTRREEVSATGWPQEQIEAFLKQQFEAQHCHYQEHFSSADFEIIQGADGSDIGRLYLDEWEKEFRIIDIALLPDHRGKGIGSDILKKIIDRAFAVGKSLSIHVEQFNPAMKLYLRLGFQKLEEQGVYHLMEIRPSETQ